jgi:hypothetical protein
MPRYARKGNASRGSPSNVVCYPGSPYGRGEASTCWQASKCDRQCGRVGARAQPRSSLCGQMGVRLIRGDRRGSPPSLRSTTLASSARPSGAAAPPERWVLVIHPCQTSHRCMHSPRTILRWPWWWSGFHTPSRSGRAEAADELCSKHEHAPVQRIRGGAPRCASAASFSR